MQNLMNKPKRIKREEPDKILIEWDDGELSAFTYTELRDNCPCVSCQGETVIFSTYIPIKSPFKPAGFYEIDKIEPVGNYAVNIIWKDGHSTGIYSWEYLRQLTTLKKKEE